MGTRLSPSEVLHALSLQTQAQLSVSIFGLVLTAVMPNGQMGIRGQWGRTFTWEPDRGAQTNNARQLSVKPPNCHRECECVELNLQTQQPHPFSLDPHTSSPQLSHPIKAPPCPPPPTPRSAHTPQSIQTDTHHHFYTSLPPPPPTSPEHTCTSTPPVNQRPGCHAVTDCRREKEGENGRKSVHQSLYHSEPSLLVVAQRRGKKGWGRQKRRYGWKQKSRGWRQEVDAEENLSVPFSHWLTAQRTRRDTPLGWCFFFVFFLLGPHFHPYPPCSLGLPSNDPAAIVSHCSVRFDCCWLVKWQIPKWRG